MERECVTVFARVNKCAIRLLAQIHSHTRLIYMYIHLFYTKYYNILYIVLHIPHLFSFPNFSRPENWNYNGKCLYIIIHVHVFLSIVFKLTININEIYDKYLLTKWFSISICTKFIFMIRIVNLPFMKKEMKNSTFF